MLPESIHEGLWTLATAVENRPDLEEAVRMRWRAGADAASSALPKDLRVTAEQLSQALPALTHDADALDELGKVFGANTGDVLFAWCAESAWRRGVRLAPLLERARESRGEAAAAEEDAHVENRIDGHTRFAYITGYAWMIRIVTPVRS